MEVNWLEMVLDGMDAWDITMLDRDDAQATMEEVDEFLNTFEGN